jgi:hypothetical protein
VLVFCKADSMKRDLQRGFAMPARGRFIAAAAVRAEGRAPAAPPAVKQRPQVRQ